MLEIIELRDDLVSTPVIAKILDLLGYSANDTNYINSRQEISDLISDTNVGTFAAFEKYELIGFGAVTEDAIQKYSIASKFSNSSIEDEFKSKLNASLVNS